MYKIGDFSNMSKTTIKTLRYYETSQLVGLSKIVHLRQAGLSIKDIKCILSGNDTKEVLEKRKTEIEKQLFNYNTELSKINYLLEGNMKNKIFVKEIPSYIIYYSDGVISDFSKITEFVLNVGEECAKANPNLKCINPDYCYVSYLDGEYKEKDIKVRYAQAVEEYGKETENVKFMKSDEITAVCIYHKGSYENLRDSYNVIIKYIEDNGYEIIDNPRECYIDGCWNKDSEDDYLTEIEFPVKKVSQIN